MQSCALINAAHLSLEWRCWDRCEVERRHLPDAGLPSVEKAQKHAYGTYKVFLTPHFQCQLLLTQVATETVA